MKKRNRKMRKVLLMTCCALVLVAISVGATLAYLTDTEAVTNVFTVGKVGISLNETKTDVDGKPVTPAATTQTNSYHLIPGRSYTKDPTVHVDADSESSWIFVKVENGIANIEASTNTIASQITNNGWTELSGVPNVYYRAYTKGQTKDLEVFDSFTLKGESLVNGKKPQGYTGPNEFIGDYADKTVNVTAYAIQKAGFEGKPVDAWNAGKFN